MAKTAEGRESSAADRISFAMASGAHSPSAGAQMAGEIIAPPGAELAVAQGMQMTANGAIVASRELMDATIRQHGVSSAAQLQDMQTKITLAKGREEVSRDNERGDQYHEISRGRR